jgi:hypothetical protein
MTTANSSRPSAVPPDHFIVHTLGGTKSWAFQSLHREAPVGFETGWQLLEELPVEVRQQLERGCVDTDTCFPAVVDGQPCVVIEQEFQALDAGDDWPEKASAVVTRLTRHLLPRLAASAASAGAVAIGVAADVRTTFRGRPTVFVALPAPVQPETVRSVLSCLRGFAYPQPH